MKKEKSVPTKEEIEGYISELQESVGDAEKIEKTLENQEMLVAYLAQIGVKKSWLDRAAVVEITKQKMASILLRGKHVRVSEKGIEYGKSEMSVKDGVFYIYNTGADDEYIKFEEAKAKENSSKEGEERFERATKNDEFIAFSEENETGKLEKLIDRNGVVQFEKAYIRDVWGLLPKDTYVRDRGTKTIKTTTISEVEGEAIVNRSEGEDFGHVTTAKPIANIYAVEMLAKYPNYKAWFESKGFSIDDIVTSIEVEHQGNLETIQSGYEEAESHKTFGKSFNRNEKTLGEFYAYLNRLSPIAKKAFMSSLIVRRGKDDEVVKVVTKKMELAAHGKLEVRQDDLELVKYDSMEDLNKAAKIRAQRRNEILGKTERSEEEEKFDLYRAREELIQENWSAQKRIRGYHYRVYHQGREIDAIKAGVKGIPFVGKKLVKGLSKEDTER